MAMDGVACAHSPHRVRDAYEAIDKSAVGGYRHEWMSKSGDIMLESVQNGSEIYLVKARTLAYSAFKFCMCGRWREQATDDSTTELEKQALGECA